MVLQCSGQKYCWEFEFQSVTLNLSDTLIYLNILFRLFMNCVVELVYSVVNPRCVFNPRLGGLILV